MQLVPITVLSLFALGGFFSRLFSETCPKCKSSGTAEVLRKKLVSWRNRPGALSGHYDTHEYSYRCKACGHEWKKKKET